MKKLFACNDKGKSRLVGLHLNPLESFNQLIKVFKSTPNAACAVIQKTCDSGDGQFRTIQLENDVK